MEENNQETNNNQMASEGQSVNGSQMVNEGQPVNGSQQADEGQPVNGSQMASEGQPVNGSQMVNEGQSVNGSQMVNEGQSVNGSQQASEGQTVNGSQMVNEGQPVNGSQQANEGQTVNGSQQASEGQTVNGSQQVNEGQLVNGSQMASESQAANSSWEAKQTEYTGEYGNAVAGEYRHPDSSVYSYSYKNGNGESTHSGDYYADRDSAGQGDAEMRGAYYGAPGSSNESGYQNSGSSGNSSGSGYQNSGSSGNSSGSGYQNSGSSGNYSGSGYQNGGGLGNGYQNGGSSGNYGGYHAGYTSDNANSGKMKKQKKENSAWNRWGKKAVACAVCSFAFGLLGAFAFHTADGLVNREKAEIQTQENDTVLQDDSAADVTASPDSVDSAGNSSDITAIAEQCMPAVVAITSTTEGTDYYDLFGRYYQGEDTDSSGTGFVVGQNEKELLIATNNHVISGAKTISVQFIDGEIYEAAEKGSDTANDLAVVAVDVSKVKKATMEKIKIADMGNSDKAKVGERVIAIGNALGYGQSVTVGYISAKDREITESSQDGSTQNTIKAIQTDAAINPGNSGGALINMQGQVIGINSAKIADSAVEGVGYAIPISVATPIIDELMNREILKDSEKGYLGISGSTVSQEASAYNLPYGVYVKEVSKGGAADKAGIKVNDVITAVNKMEVTTIESLQEKVNSYRKGTEVEITLKRSTDGVYKEQKVKVTLQGSSSLDGLSEGTVPGNGENGNGDNGNNGNGGNGDNGSNGNGGNNGGNGSNGNGGDNGGNGSNGNGGNNGGNGSNGNGSDGNNNPGEGYDDFWGDFFGFN